nr:hypothetical protein [Aliamphritea spongicola]
MKDKIFILLQHLLPQHLLSRLVGKLADCRINWVKAPLSAGSPNATTST